MLPQAEKILDESYEYYQKGTRALSQTFTNTEVKEQNDFIEILDYLSKNNLIHWWWGKTHQSVCWELKVEGLNYVSSKPILPPPTSVSYTIHNVNAPSNIGNQQMAIINASVTLDELKELISSIPVQDQEKLNEMLQILEEIDKSDQPVKKNFLSKFSDVLAKYSNVAIALANFLFQIFTR